MNKINKKQIILIFISIVLAGVTLIVSVFAWFFQTDLNYPIVFTAGNVEVSANLYQANDPNFDGLPAAGESFQDSDYTLVTGPIVLSNVASNQIFTFKLVVQNNGTIPAKLTITLKNLPDTSFNNAVTLKYSDLDGSTFSNVKTAFPTGDFIIGTKESLSYVTNSNETVLLFQLVINKNLTNALYGEDFVISSIEVSLEQIPPSVP